MITKMITRRKTPSGGNRDGALEKGTGEAPFKIKTTTTSHKIKGFLFECLLAVAAIPTVLLLAPLAILAVARLFGRSAS